MSPLPRMCRHPAMKRMRAEPCSKEARWRDQAPGGQALLASRVGPLLPWFAGRSLTSIAGRTRSAISV